MSEIGDSLRRLERASSALETGDKILVGVQSIGLAAMIFAIAVYFGWAGVLFLVGGLLWKCAGSSLSPPSKEGE